ncbi:hypothetical protein [Haloplanus aerogenes]|uniref:Uncharacterized protein n=1 Tax=Haloplanus aerogenes TaxID=660522 RepID=A0A3M0DPN1_9EURY|nr:hypothetical protein [Haloplanus aerogenes]AZH24744.1 hypothetical protein DU502_04800 [Haloplanus aerogenes]RMB23594.1 hypothetical protein ATH50_0814 [Haloplanus aerogenes]
MPSQRAAASLLVGCCHAVGLLFVAHHLGYAVGPAAYTVVGAGWRYAGLVVVAAVPVWLALRYRFVAPLAALLVTTGYVLGMELTPPGPTFHDVAEFERLSEPTGLTVVENGLYIVRYMVNASVWTLGFGLLGVVEDAMRTDWHWLPSVSPSPLSRPAAQRQAAEFAAVGGVVHAVVMTWFAVRLGLTVTGGLGWVLYPLSVVGMWLLAAVPLYLLVRRRLIAPATLLTAFVLLDARAEFAASVDDPHALYFGGWFLSLALLLVAGGVEYGGRQLALGRRLASLR